MPCAVAAASGACSGLTTSWPMPVESRRSMKIEAAVVAAPSRPSRRACDRCPTCSRRSSPAPLGRASSRPSSRLVERQVDVLSPRAAGAPTTVRSRSRARRRVPPVSAGPSATVLRSPCPPLIPARRSSPSRRRSRSAAPLRLDGEEDVDCACDSTPGSTEREQRGARCRSRSRSPASEARRFLDQPVVAAASADRVLRADRLVLELEGRARVVVEPAHERRREPVARRRARRGSCGPAAKCASHSSQSDSPIFGACGEHLLDALGSVEVSKTRSGVVSRFARASSSSSASCSASQRSAAAGTRGGSSRRRSSSAGGLVRDLRRRRSSS